ncbi:hypothetical protein M427DRAFT_145667 [Gonapodya prolifera JEL478]|uniref:Uncharacterized protein n=1 Tax=Gonapodya prolifera (strain JEL478) TaxID=1344416 RepID=A0A139AF81_GONPJ|nr:hypothetical protein M427DRAFT_145667 [Gonapodya prolifera JEL478]|eukprot:KXS15085.1 hypothetical protein M427DRAFT_145667 [Gonapodya prolifera JEL478]
MQESPPQSLEGQPPRVASPAPNGGVAVEPLTAPAPAPPSIEAQVRGTSTSPLQRTVGAYVASTNSTQQPSSSPHPRLAPVPLSQPPQPAQPGPRPPRPQAHLQQRRPLQGLTPRPPQGMAARPPQAVGARPPQAIAARPPQGIVARPSTQPPEPSTTMAVPLRTISLATNPGAGAPAIRPNTNQQQQSQPNTTVPAAAAAASGPEPVPIRSNCVPNPSPSIAIPSTVATAATVPNVQRPFTSGGTLGRGNVSAMTRPPPVPSQVGSTPSGRPPQTHGVGGQTDTQGPSASCPDLIVNSNPTIAARTAALGASVAAGMASASGGQMQPSSHRRVTLVRPNAAGTRSESGQGHTGDKPTAPGTLAVIEEASTMLQKLGQYRPLLQAGRPPPPLPNEGPISSAGRPPSGPPTSTPSVPQISPAQRLATILPGVPARLSTESSPGGPAQPTPTPTPRPLARPSSVPQRHVRAVPAAPAASTGGSVAPARPTSWRPSADLAAAPLRLGATQPVPSGGQAAAPIPITTVHSSPALRAQSIVTSLGPPGGPMLLTTGGGGAAGQNGRGGGPGHYLVVPLTPAVGATAGGHAGGGQPPTRNSPAIAPNQPGTPQPDLEPLLEMQALIGKSGISVGWPGKVGVGGPGGVHGGRQVALGAVTDDDVVRTIGDCEKMVESRLVFFPMIFIPFIDLIRHVAIHFLHSGHSALRGTTRICDKLAKHPTLLDAQATELLSQTRKAVLEAAEISPPPPPPPPPDPELFLVTKRSLAQTLLPPHTPNTTSNSVNLHFETPQNMEIQGKSTVMLWSFRSAERRGTELASDDIKATSYVEWHEGCKVWCNGKRVPVEKRIRHTGTEGFQQAFVENFRDRPADIGPFLKPPGETNLVHVTWDDAYQYPKEKMFHLEARWEQLWRTEEIAKHAEERTLELGDEIARLTNHLTPFQDPDGDIEMVDNNLEHVTLIDRWSGMRIVRPALGVGCGHIQKPFDLDTYLYMNRRSPTAVEPKWRCPYLECSRTTTVSNLRLSKFFVRLLAELPADATEVTLSVHRDGIRWEIPNSNATSIHIVDDDGPSNTIEEVATSGVISAAADHPISALVGVQNILVTKPINLKVAGVAHAEEGDGARKDAEIEQHDVPMVETERIATRQGDSNKGPEFLSVDHSGNGFDAMDTFVASAEAQIAQTMLENHAVPLDTREAVPNAITSINSSPEAHLGNVDSASPSVLTGSLSSFGNQRLYPEAMRMAGASNSEKEPGPPRKKARKLEFKLPEGIDRCSNLNEIMTLLTGQAESTLPPLPLPPNPRVWMQHIMAPLQEKWLKEKKESKYDWLW